MLKKAASLILATLMVLTFTACTNMNDDGNRVEKNNVDDITPLDMNMNNRGLDMNRSPMGDNIRDDNANRGMNRTNTLDNDRNNTNFNNRTDMGTRNGMPVPNMGR